MPRKAWPTASCSLMFASRETQSVSSCTAQASARSRGKALRSLHLWRPGQVQDIDSVLQDADLLRHLVHVQPLKGLLIGPDHVYNAAERARDQYPALSQLQSKTKQMEMPVMLGRCRAEGTF